MRIKDMSGEEMGEKEEGRREGGEESNHCCRVALLVYRMQMPNAAQVSMCVCVCVCFFGILVAYIAVVPRIVYVMYVIPTASTYLFCFASKK